MVDEKKYKMSIAYDGTRYCGWQIQPNGPSIQGHIENALLMLLKNPVRLIGAGRTDSGVHALEQVAHFTLAQSLDCRAFLYALNGTLPQDIRIKGLSLAHPDFHAQYGAVSKEYHYHLWLEKTMEPFFHLYRHHFHDSRFQLPLLEEAVGRFIGTHDFTTFTNLGGSTAHCIRTIKRIDILSQRGGLRLEFEGNGFLYKMVRNIVGTLLEVACGKKAVSSIDSLFDAKDRRCAGPAAPAKGLFLAKITYKPEFWVELPHNQRAFLS